MADRNHIVKVITDPAQERRVALELAGIRGGMPLAISRAIRRTTDQSRVRIVRGVAEDLNVQQRKLFTRGNRRRPIRQSFTFAGRHVVQGRVEVQGRYEDGGTAASQKEMIGRIPMAAGRFAIAKIRGGISYKIFRQGARKRLIGPDPAYNMSAPFIAQMRSGFRAAFRRHRGTGKLALLHGPSIPHVAQQRPAIKALLDFDARDLYAKNLRHEVNFLLSRRALRGAA